MDTTSETVVVLALDDRHRPQFESASLERLSNSQLKQLLRQGKPSGNTVSTLNAGGFQSPSIVRHGGGVIDSITLEKQNQTNSGLHSKSA